MLQIALTRTFFYGNVYVSVVFVIALYLSQVLLFSVHFENFFTIFKDVFTASCKLGPYKNVLE